MSEHRRKPPNGGRAGGGGGRRRAPSGGPAPRQGGGYDAAGGYGGRTGARRAAGGGGGRRRAAPPDEYAGSRSGGHGGGGRRGGGGYGGDDDYGRPRRRRSEPAKKRFIDYPRHDRDGLKAFVPSWKQVLGMCVLGFGLLVALTAIGLALVSKPNVALAAQQQNNVYYWSDGSQMAATGGQTNRQIIPLAEIPRTMQTAIISAENASFYEDSGIDPKGIARALFNMAKGGDTQSGSTITQQYVKNAMLNDQSQTLSRKVKELFVSIKVGASEQKDTILEGYLNTAYYGRGAYGIQAAAQAYFKKDASKLNASETAVLAAVLKGPNFYDPHGGEGPGATPKENLARAKERWAWILDRQTEVKIQGKVSLTPAERAKYRKYPKVEKWSPGGDLTGQTGYLIDTADKYVRKTTGLTKQEMELGGYQIYTTFDKKKVMALQASVDKARKKHIDEKRRKDKFVQFGGASVEPETGKIVAIYGGPGFDKGHFFNNADALGVPVGSTWKPIVLATAMDKGTYATDGEGISAQSVYNANDNQVIVDQDGEPVPDKDGEPFRQKNEGETNWGPRTLEFSMLRSINSPFVQLGIDVGLSNVAQTAESMGILKDTLGNTRIASFALGTATPSAIRMASAYATFAAEGTHIEPFSVVKVKKDGQEINTEEFGEHKKSQAFDENVANNVTQVLEKVVSDQNGTGHAAAALGRPAAGKTGTTDSNASAWFVGYTPQLTTSISMYRPDPKSLDPDTKEKVNKDERTKDFPSLLSMNGTAGVESIHGGAIPTEVWTDYMKAALNGKETVDFTPATPITNKIYGGGAKKPEPKPKHTEEPDDPTTGKPEKPGGAGGQTCDPTKDPNCWGQTTTDGGTTLNGGTTDGGTTTDGTTTDGNTIFGTTDGGTTGGTSPSPSPSPTGNSNGGGGPRGLLG
ncbi:Monofunctional biosynthetic peptidoglycan transglycosylase [Streptomyces sp. RB5]|uniref:Monofunctional biosynthetic peptidoglycan transglycosylase n=1 Tax=Streptomyces smaragdinus TaxID=2585196 RepID=A0A7K0CH00_9ACTN|nr:transglycosylase domain-containing protein [Streptomyces smaragdinus]MQY12653.1 Monofunctional biosynthetic peptidoglycan transglycosylase [Streptomyces smaragdinus]